MKTNIIRGTETTPNAIRYYVLRGRQGGQYYSHRVGSTVHTSADAGRLDTYFSDRRDAEALQRSEGPAAWEVVTHDSLHAIPGAR